MNDIITPKEVSEITGYSLSALANMRVKKESFPFYKHGRKVFYKESEVLKAIEDTKVDTKTSTKAS